MGTRWRGFLLVAVVTIVVLATTGVWNPWPKVWAWVDTSGPIAGDAARWQQRIGGSPQSVSIAGRAVIVEYRTSVEAYDLTAGVKLWRSDADWAAITGGGDAAAVVTGRLLTKGYQVLDPRTGAVRRADTAATAVWTYRDAVLDLSCRKGGECRLANWAPGATEPDWTVDTGGLGFVLDAANPDLPDTRRLATDLVDDDVSRPQRLPELIGLPDDGRIRVIDTASGKVARVVRAERDQRIAVTGGRVLTVTATAGDGTCYFDTVATGGPGGTPVWRRTGLNLRTAANGANCKQENDPAGGEDVVLGVDPTGREELIAAHDGRRLWHGERGESVLAVDDTGAVIRNAAKDEVRGLTFRTGRTVWKRAVSANSGAALTRHAALVVSPDRVVALAPTSGKVLADVRTEAKVFAVGPAGLIAVSGRDMAYLPFR